MCIIAYKTGNQKMWTLEEIAYMMNRNSDGVGIMYNHHGHVYIKKGFFQPESVMQILEHIPSNSSVVFHARIATSGGVSASLCHPYPIKKSGFLRTSEKTDIAMAHNGVINIKICDKRYNDTITFIRDYICPMHNRNIKTITETIKKEKEIDKLVGYSRLCFLDSLGHIETVGYFYTDKEGRHYSNSGFLGYTAPVYYQRHFYYDDFSEFDNGYSCKIKDYDNIALFLDKETVTFQNENGEYAVPRTNNKTKYIITVDGKVYACWELNNIKRVYDAEGRAYTRTRILDKMG